MVFSHGNGFNAMTHRQALEPLGDRLRIVAIDQRAHGRTALPMLNLDRDNWCDLSGDLIAVIAALEIEKPVVLAGHSMGGTISLLSLDRLKDRVKALALFDPVIPPRMTPPDEPHTPYLHALHDMTLKRRARFASRGAAFEGYQGKGIFKSWPSEALADYVEDAFVEDGEGVRLTCDPRWEASNFLAQRQPSKVLLLAVDRPTTVLRAPSPPTTCHVAPDEPGVVANPMLEVSIIEATTHLLPVERPDLVREALLKTARG